MRNRPCLLVVILARPTWIAFWRVPDLALFPRSAIHCKSPDGAQVEAQMTVFLRRGVKDLAVLVIRGTLDHHAARKGRSVEVKTNEKLLTIGILNIHFEDRQQGSKWKQNQYTTQYNVLLFPGPFSSLQTHWPRTPGAIWSRWSWDITQVLLCWQPRKWWGEGEILPIHSEWSVAFVLLFDKMIISKPQRGLLFSQKCFSALFGPVHLFRWLLGAGCTKNKAAKSWSLDTPWVDIWLKCLAPH